MRAALVAGTLALVAGCGGSSEPTTAAVQDALEARLIGKSLSFKWVYCMKTKRSFEDRRMFRCKVNFGEPHIVIYCATLEHGVLVTNRERPEMRCGRSAGS